VVPQAERPKPAARAQPRIAKTAESQEPDQTQQPHHAARSLHRHRAEKPDHARQPKQPEQPNNPNIVHLSPPRSARQLASVFCFFVQKEAFSCLAFA
jgi:hypothetical protein